MRIEEGVKLDYCDVLIKPKRSSLPSRSKVSLNKTYQLLNSEQFWDGIPLIASNMSCVGTFAMAKELSEHGMAVALHKHYEVGELVAFFKANEMMVSNHVFYTMGITEDDFDKFKKVLEKVPHIPNVCIDVANGYTEFFQSKVKAFRESHPAITIMAGNVATPEMVSELLLSGAADIVKIGIGSGSVCTTRLVCGVGYPQLSAVAECADAAHGLGGHICSDGGIQIAADVPKAFGAGADFVMMGGFLAGCDECEGEWIMGSEVKWHKVDGVDKTPVISGKYVKKELEFYGMSSRVAQDKYNGGLKPYRAAEGKSVRVPYKGPVKDTLQEITGGLVGACSMVGAKNLKDLPKCTTFIRVNRTHNTLYGE